MWAWAVCLLAALAQAILPVVHVGHGHVAHVDETCGSVCAGPVHLAPEPRGGHDTEGACALCVAISLTRAAVLPPAPGVAVCGAGPQWPAPLPASLCASAQRLTDAPARAPPARA